MFGEMFEDRPMVLVLGLGASGFAIARWCARQGCRLRVADTRETPPNLAGLTNAGIEAEFVSGALHPGLLGGGIELVAVSPGLSPLDADLAPLLATARASEIPVWGELEFFAQALNALGREGYTPKVLAITGTNGKTTTTSLTGQLCARAGKRVAVAGNIGPTILDTLAEAIDRALLPDVWVLELSSFQLETVQTFAPDVAALLNITQDHLDWHGGLEAYTAAKGHIFGPRTVRILNRDDPATMAFATCAPAERAPRIISVGLNEPVRDGDYGLLRDNGINWLVEACDFNATSGSPATRRRKNSAEAPAALSLKRLMPADALRIRGLHNVANALAAFALARAIDLPGASLLHGLREYRGEAHRVELITSLDGIDYIDDSKGTNVGATCAALDGLAQRTILIVGGDGKGQDFAPLAAPVTRWCRAVLLIGQDAPLIRAALAETGVPLVDYTTLETAVRAASESAQRGDAVLLSPACASFDMFRDYAHRAAVFHDAVKDIALEKGVTI